MFKDTFAGEKFLVGWRTRIPSRSLRDGKSSKELREIFILDEEDIAMNYFTFSCLLSPETRKPASEGWKFKVSSI